MKLESMFTPFSTLSQEQKTLFITNYRRQQSLDLSRVIPTQKVSKRKARKVQLEPEKMELLKKLLGDKLLKKVLK